MKAAIVQSNYLPWKGYFDIIHDVDVYVFLEDVQYTKNDWRNRNKIKTPFGVKWITVPVKGGIRKKIYEVEIAGSTDWKERQKRQIEASYSRAPFYESYRDEIFEIFLKNFNKLSELNIFAITRISELLGIGTRFLNSRDFVTAGRRDDKLIEICRQIGADSYLSGPAAKNYIKDEKFSNENIELAYKDYSGYPEYPQLWGGFDHNVSVIDLIFHCGERSPHYIWGWRDGKT
jgi:WbqC-like protein family